MFISGLIVVINANNSLGTGCCFFLSKYLVKYGKLLVAFIWLGWSVFSIGENDFARC